MINGVLGYSVYYNNNESYLRGVSASQEAKAASQASIPVQAVADTVAQNSSQNSTFSKSGHFEGDVAGFANRSKMKELSEEELGLLKKADATKTPQEVMEDSECKTCAERKYQDGSDDPGVSFKTAAHISPEQSASKVRSHEYEHVVREQSKADREDKEVVSQTVTLHTNICPECGRTYVSGGLTRTVTKGKGEQSAEDNNVKAEKPTE
ncbi:MAG: hypothetical protein IKC01_00415 [Clostridia bacterium]|nr:hypothetical protein [Clostridia bacterium]